MSANHRLSFIFNVASQTIAHASQKKRCEDSLHAKSTSCKTIETLARFA